MLHLGSCCLFVSASRDLNYQPLKSDKGTNKMLKPLYSCFWPQSISILSLGSLQNSNFLPLKIMLKRKHRTLLN